MTHLAEPSGPRCVGTQGAGNPRSDAFWDYGRDPLAELARGHRELFERFVAERGAALRGFFRRMGADPSEAEDLAQDVFLKLYRTASNYDPKERFAAYFFRVARNAWIDRSRARGARRDWAEDCSVESLNALASGGEQPSEQLAREEQGERLRRALGGLPEGQRLAFELGVIQGLSYEDVSSALSIPLGTVKSRVFMAVRRMRAVLRAGMRKSSRARVPR